MVVRRIGVENGDVRAEGNVMGLVIWSALGVVKKAVGDGCDENCCIRWIWK